MDRKLRTRYCCRVDTGGNLEIALLLAVVFFALVAIAVWFAMRDPAPATPAASPAASAPAATPAPAPPRPRTIFDLAAEGDTDGVRALIDENPERLHLCDESGWTALHHAAYNDHAALIGYLLEAGADANAVGEGECAPIHVVATDGSPASLAKLIEGGADVSIPDDTGATALHFAALNKRVDMARALIGHGAPVNMKDAQADTPLDIASRFNDEALTGALAESGGKPGAEVTMADVLATLPEQAAARRIVPRTWHLDAEDPRFLASIDQAKASVPKLVAHLEANEDAHAAVKFAVRGKGVVEYVWGEVEETGPPLKVVLQAPPTAVDLDSDVVEVPHDEVVDWQLKLDEERTAGGYGQRATFEAIRTEYGFLPADIEAELSHLVDL